MTTDDQRKAIASAVGITNIKPCPYRHPKDTPEWVGESPKPFVGWMCCHTKIPRYSGRLPKYTEDLNAMHGAEATLTPYQRQKHAQVLQELLNEAVVGFVEDYARQLAALSRVASATAEQRAEAFLKTLNLWKDEA